METRFGFFFLEMLHILLAKKIFNTHSNIIPNVQVKDFLNYPHINFLDCLPTYIQRTTFFCWITFPLWSEMFPFPITKKYSSVWNILLSKYKSLKFTLEKSEEGRTNKELLLWPSGQIDSLGISNKGKKLWESTEGNRCNAVIFADQETEDKNSQPTAKKLQVSNCCTCN